MNRASWLLLLALIAPASAQADAIAGLGFTLGPDGVDVALRGTAPLRHPRIATSPGLVRLWFGGNEEYVHLDQRGDGVAVRKIRIRPGAEATHLVQILLGDERRLDPAAVRVEVAGTMAHVHIARSDLPALRAPQVATVPTEPAPSATAAAEPAQQATGEVTAAVESQAPTLASAAAPGASPAASPTTSHPRPATPDRDAAPAARPPPRRVAPVGAPRGPGIAVYALLTLGLGGAYIVLRLLRRGGAGRGRAPIEVVAARRLGPRHQLLIVRAFGRDHLLSVNGGTTQRIASVRSPEASEKAASAPAPKATGGLFSKPWIDRNLSRADGGDGDAAGAEPAFGAELLHLASATGRSPAPARSDSVSGLLRLRQQAGK